MIRSPLIYSRGSKGEIRTWRFEVDGGRWRTVHGTMNGAKVESGWTTVKPKNVGKKNETTVEAQAVFEAEAAMAKRLDRDYRERMEDLDSVPPSPMLAQDFGKQKAITFPVAAQPKLDGIRALISRHGAFSRDYQRHHNVEHILDDLADFFADFPDVVLDGELYNHDLRDDFNTITSVVRKQNVGDDDRMRARKLIQFHCYDMIPDGEALLADATFVERERFLCTYLPDYKASIVRVETLLMPDRQTLDKFYYAWLDQGYEGQMVRVLKSPYGVDKRPKDLLKRKEFITEEFPLVDIQEGNGNWAGYAKRIVVRLKDGTTNDAGMRGDQVFAKALLDDKDRYIGGEVTIRYFGVTPDGKLRMPVAIDFHPTGRAD